MTLSHTFDGLNKYCTRTPLSRLLLSITSWQTFIVEYLHIVCSGALPEVQPQPSVSEWQPRGYWLTSTFSLSFSYKERRSSSFAFSRVHFWKRPSSRETYPIACWLSSIRLTITSKIALRLPAIVPLLLILMIFSHGESV